MIPTARRQAEAKAAPPKRIRCAIYTRKSTEEGLEQEFNSLDAQREAAEAFIRSQAHEGWVAIEKHYDDGGYSGGSLERPGLTALLEDIAAGEVDCVVVYKVDRLSRSLMDFSRIVESFERNKVSFVSVTQQFNTTHSMGRLTLNILLSFAQFEREIIGERIRDKIHAQRRKGKWTGGKPVLGYDVDRSGPSPKLVVNEAEAERVRGIFEAYLKGGSLLPATEAINALGWRTKAYATKAGQPVGGDPFSRKSVNDLLRNPLYVGRVRVGKDTVKGEHQAIVPQDLFDRVQERLSANARLESNDFRNKHDALLRRLLRCKHCDSAMVHIFAGNKGPKYRYYQCACVLKHGRKACPTPNLPAREIEALVVEEARQACSKPQMVRAVLDAIRRTGERVSPKLKAAVKDFDGLWDALEPRERVMLTRLLIRRIDFDAKDQAIDVQFYGDEPAPGMIVEAA